MNTVVPFSAPAFSPFGVWNRVRATEVQEVLRQFFDRWGRPQRLRVDNGHPWGSGRDLPPALILWLVGLEVELLWIPPRCPQCNGVVERSQGTSKRWVEPAQCLDLQDFQRRVDEEDRVQREVYPSCAGCCRRDAYPGLCHSGRGYCRSWEPYGWCGARVLQWLSGWTVTRRVDQQGKISVYDWGHQVGLDRVGAEVRVQLEAGTQEWVVRDRQGQEISRWYAQELAAATIGRLQVARRSGQREVACAEESQPNPTALPK